MKLVKLDRRHHGYRHYTHFVQVHKLNAEPVRLARKILEKDFGPSISWVQNGLWGHWVRNSAWYWDTKRNRVYFNGEDKASHVMLQL
jgi:hypothetical protein